MSLKDDLMHSWQETVAPYRQKWLLLAPREQLILQIFALFLSALILVYGIWLPSRHAAEKAQRQFEKNQGLVSLLQSKKGSPKSNAVNMGGSVLGVVSGTATSNGLALTRIEPEMDGQQVRVWLDKADFNRIASWLVVLDKQGIALKEAQVEKQGDSGVSARLMLSR